MCSKAAVQNKLRSCVGFLEKFVEIIDCHMVEYFTGNLMQKVPQDVLNQVLPLNKDNFVEFRKAFDRIDNTLDSFTELQPSNLEDTTEDIFTDYMNPKKIHEVAVMAKYINETCDKSKGRVVIDAGGGLGYLSQWLAYNYNFKVLGIDSNKSNSENASKRSNKVTRKVKLFQTKIENYKTRTEFIDERTDFRSMVYQSFPDSVSPEIILTGLHTCGSLSNNCIKIFRKRPEIRKLFNVGCCYNLLNENDFPMSSYLFKEIPFKLSRNARMLAAYSLDRTFELPDLSNLDKIFYRALLEKLLMEQESPIRLRNVGQIKCKSFVEYVQKVQLKFKDQFSEPISETEVERFFDENQCEWNELLKFYLFRMSFAPVIEAVIVLDKVLFLLEESTITNVQLIKLFNPVLSPRCFLISANK